MPIPHPSTAPYVVICPCLGLRTLPTLSIGCALSIELITYLGISGSASTPCNSIFILAQLCSVLIALGLSLVHSARVRSIDQIVTMEFLKVERP